MHTAGLIDTVALPARQQALIISQSASMCTCMSCQLRFYRNVLIRCELWIGKLGSGEMIWWHITEKMLWRILIVVLIVARSTRRLYNQVPTAEARVIRWIIKDIIRQWHNAVQILTVTHLGAICIMHHFGAIIFRLIVNQCISILIVRITIELLLAIFYAVNTGISTKRL